MSKKNEKDQKNQYADPTLGFNQMVYVCGFCANHDNRNVVIEVNFIDQAIYYKCTKCKKMNILDFSLMKQKPYPRTIMRSTTARD